MKPVEFGPYEIHIGRQRSYDRVFGIWVPSWLVIVGRWLAGVAVIGLILLAAS